MNHLEFETPKRCQKCNKEIVWLRHKTTGKPAPIETSPDANGNVLVRGDHYRIALADEIEKAKSIDKPLYLNHFASCKFAEDFKKRK